MTAEATTPPGLDFAVERPLLKRAEGWLAAAVGIPAAVAVLAEVGVLLYGVINAVRVQQPAGLVGRAGGNDFPLARHVGLRAGPLDRRAYAPHDGVVATAPTLEGAR